VHSKAKEAVHLWLERTRLASNPSAPLFPSFAKNRETIESRRLDRRSVLKLVEKRAKDLDFSEAATLFKNYEIIKIACDFVS
jgi:hypothetical protein